MDRYVKLDLKGKRPCHAVSATDHMAGPFSTMTPKNAEKSGTGGFLCGPYAIPPWQTCPCGASRSAPAHPQQSAQQPRRRSAGRMLCLRFCPVYILCLPVALSPRRIVILRHTDNLYCSRTLLTLTSCTPFIPLHHPAKRSPHTAPARSYRGRRRRCSRFLFQTFRRRSP